MKKYIIIFAVAILFTATTIVVAKENTHREPFKAIWNVITGLQERITGVEDRVGIIEDELNSPDYAFCQRCDGLPWNCTRQEAAEQCESLDMHLCSLAELNQYAEIGLSTCCASWVSDPNLTERTKGILAYFMGSSVSTGIQGCGGDPGGMRIITEVDHLYKRNAHCCK